MHSTKQAIYSALQAFVEQRIANINQALALANEASKDETKSSAGDKHETGRAMAQLDQEQQNVQLAAALELQAQLNRISAAQQSTTVAVGSLLKTNKGWFYIAIGAGKIKVNDFECMTLSPSSPLAKAFIGKAVASEVLFNATKYVLEQVA